MMIEPRAGRLLRLVAQSLEATDDPRQRRAAVWLLRDLARRIDGHAAAVRQDCEDMERLLSAHGMASPLPQAARGDEEAHLALQQQLEQLQRERRDDPQLRALHLALLERERKLLGPPGGNPSLKDPP